MSRSLSSRLRGPLLSAAAAALVLTTTTALAGSGVGGVFNLGQVNTVDAQTSLNGNPGGNPLLKVTTAGMAAAVRGVASNGIGTNGVSTSGVGQQGLSNSGIGTLGTHGNTTGISPGVQGETNSTDPAGAGVVGKNNGGGPGLKAIVNAGAPPLAVNSSAKVTNLNADLLDGLEGSAFWKLGGNAGTTPGTNFLGTTDNQALELKVNGQRAFRIEPGTDPGGGDIFAPSIVGGGPTNEVAVGAYGGTISGGGRAGASNQVTDAWGTISGGFTNVAGNSNGSATDAHSATVAGGSNNTASGNYSAVGGGDANTASTPYSVVAGGHANTASGTRSTVAGGAFNTASGINAAVAGGGNVASGDSSTVPGGLFNTAGGNFSFAAGLSAQANHNGAFVWADSEGFDMASSAADQFIARARGHFFLQSDSTLDDQSGFINTSTGASLSTGGTWTNASSRSLKAGFAAISPVRILEKVAALPLTTWHYKSEPGVRHLGPVSEDFYRAFGVGDNSRSIGTVDEGGVALAAIQGLYRQNQALRAQLKVQNARLARLERAVAAQAR